MNDLERIPSDEALPNHDSVAVDPPLVRYPLAKGLMLFASYFGLQIFLAIVFVVGLMVVAAAAGRDLTDPAAITAYLQPWMGLLVLFTLAPTAVVTLGLGFWLGRGQLRSGSPTGYGLVPAAGRHLSIAVAIGIAAATLYVLSSLWLPEPPAEASSLSSLAVGTPFERIVFLLAAMVFAPPVEEFVFRGGLLAGLRSRLSRGWAFTVTTGLFGVLHLPEVFHHWPAIVVIFGLGWLLVELRDRTGSLWPPMLAHFVYNAVLCAVSQLA